MKSADYLLLAIIGICFIAAIIKMFKKGTCSCGGCSKCSGCCGFGSCISCDKQYKKAVQKVDNSENNSDCPCCRRSNNK